MNKSNVKANLEKRLNLLVISNGHFDKKSWAEHHKKVQGEIPENVPVKLIMFHPNISCKKKLQDIFHAVVIHSCDSHLAKRYHRDIKEISKEADFFIMSPQNEYLIDGTIPINGIKSIPFEKINLKILYS